MDNGRVSRRLVRYVSAAFAVAAAAGLACYLAVVGLDKADKIASVLGAFIGLSGLALAIFAPSVGTHKGQAGSEANDAQSTKADVHNVVSGAVHGTLIQGRDFGGPVNLGSGPRRSSVEPPTTISES